MGQREICIFNPFSGRKVVSSNYTSILVLYWTQFTWKWLKALFSFMVYSIYHVCNTGPSRIRGSILILTSSKESMPILKSNTYDGDNYGISIISRFLIFKLFTKIYNIHLQSNRLQQNSHTACINQLVIFDIWIGNYRILCLMN